MAERARLVIGEQLKLSREMGIRLERGKKSGECGLRFQKEDSAKKLKFTKTLSLLTNEKCSFLGGGAEL